MSVERATAVAILALALVALGYAIVKEEVARVRHGKVDAALEPAMPATQPPMRQAPDTEAPVRTAPETEAAATPSAAAQPAPERTPELAFPLAGFEHALRDNFDEPRGNRRHHALDIMAPRGTPVRAVDGGRIAKLYRGPLAGIAIYQFDEAKKRVYFYAHLDRYADGIIEGQPVTRGQVIGYVGSTGNAPESAPHLHFAVHELRDEKRWWRGKAINPYGMLRR